MFGKKIKKEKERQPIVHRVLGEISVSPQLHAANPYDIILFGRNYPVFLYINSPTFIETHEFSAAQEEAISFFDRNRSQINNIIEKQLRQFFKIYDDSVYNNKLSLENISISANGEIGAFFSSEFSDGEIMAIDPSVHFTDSFGLVIYPSERILYNEEECYVFDN